MHESQILRALQNGVRDAVAESVMPTLPVAYVDVKFDKPNDQKWLEVVHIPNNDNSAFIGQEKNYMGLLRLVLHWPNVGAGSYTRLDLLGSIADYFTKGLMLDGVQIVQAADYTGALREGDEVMYALSIRYVSYRP